MQRVVPSQLQDSRLVLLELCEVPLTLLPSQFSIINKLPEDQLYPFIHVVNEDVEQSSAAGLEDIKDLFQPPQFYNSISCTQS